MEVEAVLQEVRAARARLAREGPAVTRPIEGDFERVSLPERECDVLRDALVAEGACTVLEVGLAYGSSALAIGEAVWMTCGRRARHVVVDPFQASAFSNVGWALLRSAGLGTTSRLLVEASSLALPRLLGEGFEADAAFVDGSHRFHEVFVDLYFLRKLVRPGGLVVLDDVNWPSVEGALAYFDCNLGWRPVDLGGRLTGRRLPDELVEPAFKDFRPFMPLRRISCASTEPMKLTGFDHIVLCVSDVPRTIAFYKGILGMEVLEERPGKWSLHFGENKISLQEAATAPDIARDTVPGSGNFCVLTEEPVHSVADTLRELGIDIAAGPDEREGATGKLLSIYLRDPDGNLVEISNRL